ncbi:MAG: hypothetical protein ACRDNO_16710 [Trebonia sp.]
MELVRFDPVDYAVHDASGEMAAITQIVVRPGRVSVELPAAPVSGKPALSPGIGGITGRQAELAFA